MTRIVSRYLILMAVCYACWGALYLITAWIGAVRGPAFDASIGLDAAIPYIPAFYAPYLLCYVSPLGLFVISRDASFLKPAYLVFIAANLAAFAIFALLPVVGPPRDGSGSDGEAWTRAITGILYAIDSRYNAFPSLHVANPWIVALLSFSSTRSVFRRALLTTIAVLISVSTVFVRQHYVLDVVAGMALAGAAVGLSRARFRPAVIAPGTR